MNNDVGSSRAWWEYPNACELISHHLQRHIVVVQLIYSRDGCEDSLLASGFLLEYEGYPFYITAGHVYTQINEIRQDASYKVRKLALIDNHPVPDARLVPIDLDTMYYEHFDSDSIDLGVMLLPPIVATGFWSNERMIPFRPVAWQNRPNRAGANYCLVGTPYEWHEFEAREVRPGYMQASSTYAIVPIPLKQIEREDDESSSFWSHKLAWYGEVVPYAFELRGDIEDIKGMSGGPILEITVPANGQTKYHLVGIQSSWLPKSRKVRATRIEVLDTLLREILSSSNQS